MNGKVVRLDHLIAVQDCCSTVYYIGPTDWNLVDYVRACWREMRAEGKDLNGLTQAEIDDYNNTPPVCFPAGARVTGSPPSWADMGDLEFEPITDEMIESESPPIPPKFFRWLKGHGFLKPLSAEAGITGLIND